jgi:hypothetical protein
MAVPKTVRTYDLDGAIKDFTIPFEYLARKFVVVTLIGVVRQELVLNVDYRFSTSNTITTLRGAAWGPADSFDLIEIRRFTSATERLVDFADGSILRAYDLNTSQVQSLHIAEEARDLTADTIGVDNDGNLDARARRIVNVGDPINEGDAVTLRYELDHAASTLGNKVASEAARDASVAAKDLSVTARIASEAARDLANTYKGNALTSANASEVSNLSSKDWASKAEDSVVSGGLYSSYHYSRKAEIQANLATTNGAAQVALATTQAGIATTQAGLATTNGAAQVTLATAQADRAESEADASAASAVEAGDYAASVGSIIAADRSFRNVIINGDFNIWQRGAGPFTAGSAYSADRWYSTASSGTISRSLQYHTLGDTTIPGGPIFFMRTTATTGSATTDFAMIRYHHEDVRTLTGTVTLSFWAKADVAKNIAIEFGQNFGTAGSTDVNTIGVTKIAITTSWQKYEVTVTLPSIAGKTVANGVTSCVFLTIWMSAGSSFDARTNALGKVNGTLDLSRVQLERGTFSTPFETRLYPVEYSMCLRYYETIWGTATAANGAWFWMKWNTLKRLTPNVSFLSGGTGGASWAADPAGWRWTSGPTSTQDWQISLHADF